MKLYRHPKAFDANRMHQELKEIILERSAFTDYLFTTCLSLPAESDIYEPVRAKPINRPYADMLQHCPYFRWLFDFFETEKVSFKLNQRGGKQLYAYHCDGVEDQFSDWVRFQIPIVTNDEVRLISTDMDNKDFDYKRFQFKGSAWNDDNARKLEECLEANSGRMRSNKLEAGYIYHFDVKKVHTLVNPGDTERITLLIDVVNNDWVQNYLSKLEEVV
ncbi:MAG: hypothetical protein R3F19_25180 [Verrucomicrobiales bacterium]|nr:hypothetical protein [Verrucomicrobiae bacterium]